MLIISRRCAAFNELEDGLESVHAEAQAPLQREDARSTVQRSSWQVSCMGSWYFVGVSRSSVPNEGLLKCLFKMTTQGPPKKGSVSAVYP